MKPIFSQQMELGVGEPQPPVSESIPQINSVAAHISSWDQRIQIFETTSGEGETSASATLQPGALCSSTLVTCASLSQSQSAGSISYPVRRLSLEPPGAAESAPQEPAKLATTDFSGETQAQQRLPSSISLVGILNY